MKLYIETTVPNFLYTDDAPDKRQVTEVFFDWLRVAPDELFISKLVETEIDVCPEPKRSHMINLLASLPFTILPILRESSSLADEYVHAGIVPARFKNDALHVATAVCHNLDVVVSWNMVHLVNVRKVDRINAVNERSGRPRIRIHTPEEVLEL